MTRSVNLRNESGKLLEVLGAKTRDTLLTTMILRAQSYVSLTCIVRNVRKRRKRYKKSDKSFSFYSPSLTLPPSSFSLSLSLLKLEFKIGEPCPIWDNKILFELIPRFIFALFSFIRAKKCCLLYRLLYRF